MGTELDVVLDDPLDEAAADVGEEDGEIGIGAKSGVMVTRWDYCKIGHTVELREAERSAPQVATRAKPGMRTCSI